MRTKTDQNTSLYFGTRAGLESAAPPSFVDTYDTSHMSDRERAALIETAHGDERLSIAVLGLHRFTQRFQLGTISGEEDAVALYESLAADVEKRRAEIGLE